MNENCTARIFKIERLNNHNGPGFRTVIFMKGCPLHCVWCHNPEGISRKKEIWYITTKCIGCGTCVETCPVNALELTAEGIVIDRKKCDGCHQCVEVCPSKALEKLGNDVTTDYLMDIILKDKLYYQGSDGGVTVTGGEPGMYADFIVELFEKCRQNGIKTAFDTSGVIALKDLEPVLRLTDLLFLDLKIIDPAKSGIYTGLETSKLMDSIRWLKQFMQANPHTFKLSIRTPLVPELTDTEENLFAIVRVIKELGEEFIDAWELCEFNNLCADKYQKMNRIWAFDNQLEFKQTKQFYLELLQPHFDTLKICISGL